MDEQPHTNDISKKKADLWGRGVQRESGYKRGKTSVYFSSIGLNDWTNS